VHASSGAKGKVIANGLWNVLGFVSTVLISFLMAPVMIKSLGDDQYGIWSLAHAVVAYFLLLDLGIGVAIVRFAARFDEVKDYEARSRLFSTMTLVFVALGLLVLLITAALALAPQRPLGMEPKLAEVTRWLLMLLGANAALSLQTSVATHVLQGLGRYHTTSVIEISTRMLTAALMLLVLAFRGGLVGLGWVSLGCGVLKLAASYAACFCLPRLRWSPALWDMDMLRSIRGYSLRAFVVLLACHVSFATDALVIGAFMAPQFITFYVVAGRLIEYVKGTIMSLTKVLTPAISAFEASGNRSLMRATFLDGTRYVLWIGLPIELGLLVLGQPFLRVWLGQEFVDSSFTTLVILALPLCLIISQFVSSSILYGMGELGWYTVAVVLEAATNLGLSISLVGPLGIEGVAIGTTIPSICVNIAIAIHACRVIGVPIQQYLRSSVLMPLLICPLAPLSWLLLMYFIPIRGWGSFFFVGIAGTVIYGLTGLFVEFGPTEVVRRLKDFRRCVPAEDRYARAGTAKPTNMPASEQMPSQQPAEVSAN